LSKFGEGGGIDGKSGEDVGLEGEVVGEGVEAWEGWVGGEVGWREGLQEGREGCFDCFEEIVSDFGIKGRFHQEDNGVDADFQRDTKLMRVVGGRIRWR